MSAFTPAEIEYLQGQQLGPLATVNESGEPHVDRWVSTTTRS